MYEITKDLYEISIWEDVLVDAEEQHYEIATEATPENEVFYKKEGEEYIKLDKVNNYNGEKYIRIPRKLSFFKEEKIAVIGANDHSAPELAYNPKFIDDVKGEHTLTFTMNGKYYDKELETFVDNPYIKYLTNERKIKLFFRDEWYDLIIKKVEENKKNYSYTYTANDLFINELSKNGFKVELDTELENNQGTAEELAAQILEGTDWRVSSYTDKDEENNPAEYKSDLLVETNLDTLYKAYLCKDILVKVSADGWLPIREEEVEPAFTFEVDDRNTWKIKKGEQIYLFYSDLIAKNPEPMVLYRKDSNYQKNDNEDIIINSYNFRVTRENKVTYNDDKVPMPDFIVYDEYMPENLSISSNPRQKYFYTIDENDGTINFVTEKPEEYNGTFYEKQDEGKYGLTLEDKCRAYETIRHPETGYDRVTDEFVTYFLQRLYTKSFVKTEDKIPYSNKEYFVKVKAKEGETGENIVGEDKYLRYYGYTFDGEEYYELQYNEFLRDGETLSNDTTYYVKSQKPEYVPTTDSDVNYYQVKEYKNGVQYFYFNEIIRQYLEVHFNDAEEFKNFGKKVYYRENKTYYLYDAKDNEYKKYGNFDVYTPTDQIFNLGKTSTQFVKTTDKKRQDNKKYYTLIEETEVNDYLLHTGELEEGVDYYVEAKIQTRLKLPDGLVYYIYDYKRTEVEPGHIFDIENNQYSIYNAAELKYTDIEVTDKETYKVTDEDFTLVPKNAVFDKTKIYYIKAEDGTYQKQEINKFEFETQYFVKITPTYYFYSKVPEAKKTYIKIDNPQFINIEDIYTKSNEEAKQYYLHSLSTCLPLYNKYFVYEQSGKMIDGYIKYEDSVWSRLKGYSDTEYLSPTLVQNYLSNSVEISSTGAGWLFDGAPEDENRAGEFTNRLDDPTLPDPDLDPTSSLLILHLTDTPVYYASQTGDYLYTNYDFVVSNPMITNEEFWDETLPLFEKEQISFASGNFFPEYEYKVIDSLEEFKNNFLNRIIYSVVTVNNEDEKLYYLIEKGLGRDFLKSPDNEHNESWIPTLDEKGRSIVYYYKSSGKYDFYCIKTEDGLYKSIEKIYYNDNGVMRQALHYIGLETYYTYENGKYQELGFVEANRYVKDAKYYENKDSNPATRTFDNKWKFFEYDKQLYFKGYTSEEEFYAIVGYTKDTPLYGFKRTEDEYLIQNKAYYKIRTDLSQVNNTNNMFFESTNNFKFEGGVNQYFTYNAEKDSYEKVSYGAEAIDGMVYYQFKPTGKMHYLPYDYYKEAWENAAIRDYLDNVFPSPGYQAYVPFTPIRVDETKTGQTYWAKKTDGSFQQLDNYALRNYLGEYVYEKWEDDAIAELQAIFNFEYTEDSLTEYAKDLLELVSDLLDWADYEQESRIEILNAIDLFGIKRAIMLQKLRRLEKNYPDVEKYQRDDLLKYLGLLRTELNQLRRIEMSVIADDKVVNYIPTKDSQRVPGKKYYYFEDTDHSDGEVSRTFNIKEYVKDDENPGDIFYPAIIDGKEYRIRINSDFTNNNYSLASLIIYEFNGEIIDLIDNIEDALEAVEDTNKSETLKEVEDALKEIQFESAWTVLNPIKMFNSYEAMISIREMLKNGDLDPKTVGLDSERDEEIYKTILDFYQIFTTGNNSIDGAIWNFLGFISNDMVPFYLQSVFSRSKIEKSIDETMQIINNWLREYSLGIEKDYAIYIPVTSEDIKKMLNEEYDEVTVYLPVENYDIIKNSYKVEVEKTGDNDKGVVKYTSLSYIDVKSVKTFTSANISDLKDDVTYYLMSTSTLGEYERYEKLREELSEMAMGKTYIKVDTDNEKPNPNEKYYFRQERYASAEGNAVNATYRYFRLVNPGEEAHYDEVTNVIQNYVTNGVLPKDIYYLEKTDYIEIKEEITDWEQLSDSTTVKIEYYTEQKTLIDYSKSVTYNSNLAKVLINLEELTSLRFDDYNELKTGNKVFDDVTEAITGFTILWHLEKEERQQVVEGTKLLINLSKQLTALQISDDFIDFCLDRRYEGHKRRALNTGFAANRNVIKKLNKGEEYVLAFSLGRYFEGDEPPMYTKRGNFSYGDIENKYYYFDNEPTGIGDFALGADEYKEIFYGEPDYNTPYGWMESEGRFELATNDDTINPLFVCIAQETVKNKFATRFVSTNSSEIGRIFYHEEEGGDYICVRRPEGLFKTVKVFEKADTYKWFNGSLDQVLMNDGKWKVLFNSRKEQAKRFRRSPTYVCIAANPGLGEEGEQQLTCIPCDVLINEKVKVTDEEKARGPISGENYYIYNKDKKIYEPVTFNDQNPSFEEGVVYFREIKTVSDENIASDIQYFKRSTDNSYEGKYKLDRVSTIGDIKNDGDYYKILSVNELARGPERNTLYYVYDDNEESYKLAGEDGELENFEEGIDYYYKTYDRDHYSLYTSDDLLPDLYCFVPDNNGDYVHIIRKEQVEEVTVKWYQFWLREENMNKIYREFKDTDDLATDAPHYFKRYNSAMDYDFHTTSWKDGHIGPWREYYQRYSKFQVHLYDNTQLDENFTYWESKPFSDGSECYTLFTQEQPKRFTLHKRYKGFNNGVHQYITLDQAIEEADGRHGYDTNNLNVTEVKFTSPENYNKYMESDSKTINYNTGSFILQLGPRMIPVKIDTRMYRPFENETDSQRVPYIMLKTKDNFTPTSGVDWVYCKSQNASDTGYYRPCTVDDTNAYTNWQLAEGIDELLGLYKFLKLKDPINWNSDEPPFTFATPVEVSMLSHEYAMRVIRSLNTPYWWGRTRYHTFATYTRPADAFDNFVNFVRDFWEWGDRVFVSKIWRWATQANSADEFTRPLEKIQDGNDEVQEQFAALIRKIMKFFDFSKDDVYATKILNWLDGKGIDINSDDPDYILVNYSTPIDGINYYTKQQIDDKWTYVIWDERGEQGERKFDPNVNYFVLEAEQEAPKEWLFKDLNNNTIGWIRYSNGSSTITYHYFPSEHSSYFAPVYKENGIWYFKNSEEKTPIGETDILCYVNAKNGAPFKTDINGKQYQEKIDLVPYGSEEKYQLAPLGGFIKVEDGEEINSNIQYYVMTTYNKEELEYDNSNNLTYDARLNFWDAMYGLFGSQWSNKVERENFGVGGTAFLNTEDEFTDEVLEEIYAFTELWVKEIHNGIEKMVPFDPILHGSKDKFYRHTYSGELKDAVDGITEIYYNDGGTYKYYATKSNYDSIIPINYDGLKVSFCEYDYNAANFKIDPTQTDDSFEANMDYSAHHKTYLDFDCSNPIEGYFDLTVSPEISGLEKEDPDRRAIKERYIWWKAPVLHNYNLTEDLYNRVGTLFYTDSKSLKSYPITSAQLFKYKVYKSNNIDVLADFKKQFYEYEVINSKKDKDTGRLDTYEPTFEEYKALKRAFQGYFGYDEWNLVEEQMDIRYDGVQRKFDIYNSYLEMLSAYLNENGDRTSYLKDRIIYEPSTGQYSFRFKNRRPIESNRRISTDMIKLKLKYYESGKPEDKIWDEDKVTKIVSHLVEKPEEVDPKERYINRYDEQEANLDLQVPIADFDNIDLNRFNTYIKNLVYKYSMYKVHTGDMEDDNNYHGERPDVNDIYYTVKREEDKSYSLVSHDGFSSFPNEPFYRARAITGMEIQEPEYKYQFLNAGEITPELLENNDFYYFGYNKVNNHDTMFTFRPISNEEDYDTNIKYYKKYNGIWTRAWELTLKKEQTYESWPYIETKDGEPIFGKTYYIYDDSQKDFDIAEIERFEEGVKYYEKGGPHGNISYYTWDNDYDEKGNLKTDSILYYRENCDYLSAFGKEYSPLYAYYTHEDIPEKEMDEKEEAYQKRVDEKAKVYGKIYPYDDNYEILEDINEEIYNEWKEKGVDFYKRNLELTELSYQESATAFSQNPNSLYIKYWYLLPGVTSQEQFVKYQDSGEVPNGIYKYYYDKDNMYLRGGSDFWIDGEADGEKIKVSSETDYIKYDPNKQYYVTEKHYPLTLQQMIDNYVINEPYEKVEKYSPNEQYWSYTFLKFKANEGYRNDIRYYKEGPVYVKVTGEKYESDVVYCRQIDTKAEYKKFYTRDIIIETKIASSDSKGTKINLKVTYQVIDGLNAIWPFDSETYKEVTLWPNPDEGYLARRIEELAYLYRKDNSLWERITDPNPFKYFVCDKIISNLIGADTLVEGETYDVIVRLDTRLLAGHHDISEDYDPDELNWLSSLNDAASTWWDQEMARQEVHYKKAKQSINDFWSSLFSRENEQQVTEEAPNNSGNINNGITSLPEDKEENVVIVGGQVRKPNIITLLLPNELEQKFKFDDTLEKWDAAIEDWGQGMGDKLEEGWKNVTEGLKEVGEVVVEGFKDFEEVIVEGKEEVDEAGEVIVTEVIDFIEEAAETVVDTVENAVATAADIAVKTGAEMINLGKEAIGFLGKAFCIPNNYSLDDETASLLTQVIDNEKAVSNSISERLTSEFRRSLTLSKTSGSDEAGLAIYMAKLSDYLYEIAEFVTYTQQLGYYDFLRDYNYLSNIEDFYSTFEEKYSNPEFINRLLAGIHREAITNKYIMALPGEVPDNDDLILTNYYLYNPKLPSQDDIDTLVYDYVGNDVFNYYIYDYDDLCQKVRGVEIKEKNYLSALTEINEKFECWIKYELDHYTEEDNRNLPVMAYSNAHTPGEVKMVERKVWIAEDDETDIIFEPINILNSHISDLQNEAISALSQFNPRTYWYDKVKEEFEETDIHAFAKGVDYYIVTPSGSFKKVNTEKVKVPISEETYYTKKKNADTDLLKEYEEVKDKYYLKNIMMVPLKTIYLKQFTGDLNYAGFRYGVNLKSIKRTLDSKEFVSRLIVKENTNEHAMDGFCTIQRAAENPIKENFILNFDYYVQHDMLKREEVWRDLYDLENGYYVQLASINKNLEDLVDRIAEVNECLDRINANYEVYALARDAAQEEIENMAKQLSESLPEGIPSPWKYNMAKETQVLRTSWSDTKTKQFTTKDKNGKIVEMTEHVVQGQTRAIEIPKFSGDTQNQLKQMDIFQRNYEKYNGLATKAKEQKKLYEEKLEKLYAESDDMYRMKNNLNALFFKKYYRFIQEGSWKDDKQMDDTLYYLDALAVSRTSAFPKLTYDIQTVDLENLLDYKGYRFRIGDKTYIEDTEFFGITQSGKPYQEETIVTKLEYHLDDASKNKITVTNYKTQFEDMFKRIAAAVAKVELGIGNYNRANAVINETAIGAPSGAATVVNGVLETINGSVSIGSEGLITTEIEVPSNKIKIVNGAIYRTTDGGATYQKIISAENGLDPSLIGNGVLDLTSLTIGSKNNPELSLTANGMTAFRKNNSIVDYSTFVRFDSYGMYGIKNYKRNSSTDDSSKATLNDVFIPTNIDSIYENASYGLTWDGFFLNTGDGTGRVTIGTNQDLRMSIKNGSNAWQDRIVIGKLQDDNEEIYYGFRIIDDNNNVVLNTDDRGQLYLRHKLYISHFNDEYGTTSNNDVTIDKKLEQTNVTLGIVKAYKRNEDGSYNKGEEIRDNYSSLDYLTKVFSVKSAVDGYDLKNELKDKKEYFKQFTKKQLEYLIEPNENLAIFDNGNLYAKNAWIEGNIHATSGTFTGTLTAAKIQTVNFSKENVSAVGGTILVRPTTTILELLECDLEKHTITVITDIKNGDDSEFSPGIICEATIGISNETFIIIEEEKIEDTKSQYLGNKKFKLQRTISNNLITNDMVKNVPLVNYGGLNYIIENCEFGTILYADEFHWAIAFDNQTFNKYIPFINEPALLDKQLSFFAWEEKHIFNNENIVTIVKSYEEDEENKRTLIILDKTEATAKDFQPITLSIEGVASCISIVSTSLMTNGKSNNNNQAISLYDIRYPTLPMQEIDQLLSGVENITFIGEKVYNSILGNIPEEVEEGKVNGLYTENGIFYGKILNKPKGREGVFSGMDTNSIIQPDIHSRFEQLLTYEERQKIQEQVGNIIFWAGAKDTNSDSIIKSPFLVDSKGNMFSSNAYITNSILSNSTIRGSILEVATIVGSGENPALIIRDSDRGIVIKNEKDEDAFSIETNSLFSNLKTLEFNIKNNGYFLVSSNFSIGSEQKQYRAAYNDNKEQIGIDLYID